MTTNQGVTRQNLTNLSTWNSSPFVQGLSGGAVFNWFRVASVGGNLLFYASADGKQWALTGTIGVTSWLAARANQVGFSLLKNSHNATYSIPYFSLTGPAV